MNVEGVEIYSSTRSLTKAATAESSFWTSTDMVHQCDIDLHNFTPRGTWKIHEAEISPTRPTDIDDTLNINQFSVFPCPGRRQSSSTSILPPAHSSVMRYSP